MNTEPDTDNPATADDDDELDPGQAAAILAQATRQAQREFDPTPPWKLVIMAFVAVITYVLVIGLSVFVIVSARAAVPAWQQRPEDAR